MMKLYLKILAFVVVLLPSVVLAAGNSEVLILDATVKDKVVGDAEVIFQKIGETSVKAKTDASGKAIVSTPFGVDDENVMLIVKKQGYSPLAVKCPCDGLTYAISPNMQTLDGLRVVLTWGEAPLDLDSHLVFPNNHIYFSAKTGLDANLDVDDTDSYGPETITVEKKHHGEKYYYAVHNYSDKSRDSDNNLATSDAKVFVYIGSTLIKTYYVPADKKGTLWTVFYIDENGEFHDVNKFGYAKESDHIKTMLPKIASTLEGVVINNDNIARSKRLNRQGEDAYHARDLSKAIGLYQEAIVANPDNGQAYSNLGLAFQKNDNEAEAIWANRKAIALASGNSKNTIQASSYYNIAKIYEAKREYDEALRNYKWALEKKDNKVYVDAIKRMTEALK